MPKHHYQQYGTIENHLHHVHTPQGLFGVIKGHAAGGDFWGDVGNFFTHTLPEEVLPAIGPIIMSIL